MNESGSYHLPKILQFGKFAKNWDERVYLFFKSLTQFGCLGYYYLCWVCWVWNFCCECIFYCQIRKIWFPKNIWLMKNIIWHNLYSWIIHLLFHFSDILDVWTKQLLSTLQWTHTALILMSKASTWIFHLTYKAGVE